MSGVLRYSRNRKLDWLTRTVASSSSRFTAAESSRLICCGSASACAGSSDARMDLGGFLGPFFLVLNIDQRPIVDECNQQQGTDLDSCVTLDEPQH